VPTPPPDPVRRRRRGQELEAALLDAAWLELVGTGFANLTMESVAARAHTGVAVLYRRWANKEQLVFAAIEHYRLVHPVQVPDTGSLREDVLALLTDFGTERATFIAVAAAAALSGLLADTGLTPAQAREKFVGDQPLWRAQALYQRAHDRGEIDLDRIPPSVLTMPFDLVRHDLLMNLEPVPLERIRTVVDDLFMPLICSYRPMDPERTRSTSGSRSLG
jgi:AcrR family transcriptional regulator